MDEQKQDDQLEHIYNSSVLIQDVALKTYRERSTTEKGGVRGSGRFVLAVRHDDDFITIILVVVFVAAAAANADAAADDDDFSYAECSQATVKVNMRATGELIFVWFRLVLWHINNCRLFNAKSCLLIYIRYIFVNTF